MRRSDGFTLLEVLVAAALFAIAMTLVMGILSGATRQVRQASARDGAVILAESLLAVADMDQALRPGLRKGHSPDARYSWEMDVRPYSASTLTPDSGLTLLQLRVQVSWSEAGGQHLQWDTLRLARTPSRAAP